MALAYAIILDLTVQLSNIRAQNINCSSFEIFKIVLTNF